ncbi:MAG: ribosome biogenesis GTPase Der, partial [Desulfatiglandales bacterium]
DFEIGEALRKSGAKVIVCVNKVDNDGLDLGVSDFYQLGFEEVVGISAIHGRGIEELMERASRYLMATSEAKESKSAGPPRIALVGRPNVGKSSILNRILGQKRVIVSEIPGTTRDLVDVHLSLKGFDYILLDTPGIRKRARVKEDIEKISLRRALEEVKRADIALLVMDAVSGPVDQDLKIGELIEENYKAAIVLLNKWDLIKVGRRAEEELLRETGWRIQFLRYAPIIRFSAKTGRGLKALTDLLPRVWEDYNTRVETGRLNRVLRDLIREYSQGEAPKGGIKFYYATQVAVRPPTLVLFVNHPQSITPQYERFLRGRLRDALGLTHTPIRLIFRGRR